MTVTLIKKPHGKKPPQQLKLSGDPTYGVALGQIYLAADGSLHGCVVLGFDPKTQEVRVKRACPQGWGKIDSIDVFKLVMVRYYEAGKPDWWPKE